MKFRQYSNSTKEYLANSICCKVFGFMVSFYAYHRALLNLKLQSIMLCNDVVSAVRVDHNFHIDVGLLCACNSLRYIDLLGLYCEYQPLP